MNRLEEDKYGLYIHAPNYSEVRDRIVESEKRTDMIKLNKIPRLIRYINGAL